MSKCSCQICMKEFCRNIWVRIIYTVLLLGILALGLLYFADALQALKPFQLKNEIDIEGYYSVIDKEQHKLQGKMLDFITYGKGKVTVFHLTDQLNCISYNSNPNYQYDDYFDLVKVFDQDKMDETIYNGQDITCYPYQSKEQFSDIEKLNKDYNIVYYSAISFIVLIIVILLLIIICCDGCCKCKCCSILHMCCE